MTTKVQTGQHWRNTTAQMTATCKLFSRKGDGWIKPGLGMLILQDLEGVVVVVVVAAAAIAGEARRNWIG